MLFRAFKPINRETKNTEAKSTHFIKSISLPVAPKVVAAPKTLPEGLGEGVGLEVVEPDALEGDGVGESLGVGLEVGDGVEVALGVGVLEALGLAEELAS